MLGTLVLLGLALPRQCSHWIYPYNLERSLFKLVFQLPAGLGCSGQCGQIGWIRTRLPQLQLQPWKGWFELKRSGCCWEMSGLPGSGHSGSGCPKGRKCPPGLAGVTGSRQCAAMLWKNLAGDGGSCCFPAEHIPKSLLFQVRSCSFGPFGLQPHLLLFQGSDAENPWLHSCAEKWVLSCFPSLTMTFWDEKIFSLLLNPCAPPSWKSRFQQDEVWDAIRGCALWSWPASIPRSHRALTRSPRPGMPFIPIPMTGRGIRRFSLSP